MSEDVKPCPFCGNPEPELERIGNRHQSALVVCGQCGARMESCDEGEDSFDSWNRRSPSPLPDEVCDRLIEHWPASHTALGNLIARERWRVVLPEKTPGGVVYLAEPRSFYDRESARKAVRAALSGDPS